MNAATDPYLSEICSQPEALRRASRAVGTQRAALQQLHSLHDAHPRVVLTGMGGSYDACLAAASVLAGLGVMATTVNASELLHFRRDALAPDHLLLVVSQSGESAEIVRLAEGLAERSRPAVVSITNGFGNPLASTADLALDMSAGPEHGPSSMTFGATLVVLSAVVQILGRPSHFDVDEVAARVMDRAAVASAAAEHLLDDHQNDADALRVWLGERSLVILGRGTGRAAAELGALSLKEAAGYPAESLDTAEFRHGPLELAGPELAAVVISVEASTHSLDRLLGEELAGFGASVLFVGPADESPANVRAIAIGQVDRLLAPSVAVIPLQLLAWRIAVERARRPGEFIRGSKVTTRE